MAGAISAIMNNGIGGVGVAPGCRSISMKIWNEGGDNCTGASLQWSYVINGLTICQNIGVRVTNHSYLWSPASAAVETKFSDTRAAGIVHFASAGNGGDDAIGDPNIGYPASIASVNAVAALDPDGTLTGFSNYGPGLFISAPGVGVCGTGSCFCGTSAASPSVAGVAALVLSVNPFLTAAQVETILAQTAVNLGPIGYDTTYGWGFVNAEAAVIAATGCPGSGSCYDANGTPGCNNGNCCAQVCLVDPYCCDVEWDGICAQQAIDICLGCPREGPCDDEHSTPGCSDPFCCESVCLLDPLCCDDDFGWDATCVALAIDVCGLAPDNNDCEDAIPIHNGTTPFSISNAGNDGFSHVTECDWNAEFIADVWFDYTAECTGWLTVSTCGGVDFETFIAVYHGHTCTPGPISLITCAHDTPGCPNNTTRIDNIFVNQGDELKIRIGAYNIESGTGTVTISCEALFDDCDGAFFLDDYTGNVNISTLGASTDGPPHAACSGGYPDQQVNNDVWYDWVAPCTGTLVVSTCGSANFDTKLAVYNGCTCPVSNGNLLGCNDDAQGCSGFSSKLEVPVTEGQCYKIRVGGYQNSEGTGQMNIACNPAPSNDDCEHASLTFNGIPTPFTTENATTDGIHHAECVSQIVHDVWFRRTATCTGFMTVSTCGSNFDTQIAVYDGCACPATDARLLGCNNDAPNCGNNGSRVTVPVIEGQCYLVRVGAPPWPVVTAGGQNGPTGSGAIEFFCGPTCTGDVTLDGLVNVNDLLAVINAWGACPQPCGPSCLADTNADCLVDVIDLLAVITHWGNCFPTDN